MKISTKKRILICSIVFFFMICFLIIPFGSNSAMSFSTGAPAGYCGAPGDGNSNCTYCHTGATETIIQGAIQTDIPSSGYVPGTTYTVSAKIVRQGHSRFGFQLSPQDTAGNQVGTMNDLGPETSFTGFGKYITHSPTGTFSTDSATWYFEWVAPPAGTGNFTFYSAFNVTNNNGGYNGDTIFLSSLSYNENISTSFVDSQNSFSNLKIAENYSSNQIQVSFQMTEPAEVIISLYDLQGKLIGELYSGFRENKNFFENLDLPATYSTGIFLLRLKAGTDFHTEKIFLLN